MILFKQKSNTSSANSSFCAWILSFKVPPTNDKDTGCQNNNNNGTNLQYYFYSYFYYKCYIIWGIRVTLTGHSTWLSFPSSAGWGKVWGKWCAFPYPSEGCRKLNIYIINLTMAQISIVSQERQMPINKLLWTIFCTFYQQTIS